MPSPASRRPTFRATPKSRAADRAYLKSNQILHLPVNPSLPARQLASRLVACGDDPGLRETLGQELLAALCTTVRTPPPILTVIRRPQLHTLQAHRLRSKTYGYYQCKYNRTTVSKPIIHIFHLTAVKQQVLSPLVFLETLLHEWCHHYDYAILHLAGSPHTRGFYTRLRLLCDELFAYTRAHPAIACNQG